MEFELTCAVPSQTVRGANKALANNIVESVIALDTIDSTPVDKRSRPSVFDLPQSNDCI